MDSSRAGAHSLGVEAKPLARGVKITADDLTVFLADGRSVSAPLVWFPRLLHATAKQRRNWEILGDGEGIHWRDLDEDLSVAGLLRGAPAAALEQREGAAIGLRRKTTRKIARVRKVKARRAPLGSQAAE